MKECFILIVFILGSTTFGRDLRGTPEFDYDCTGKVDGNYPHPTKCTHYVSCVAQTHAYEMPCQMGTNGKPLHYVKYSGPDPTKSYCDLPELAGCDSEPSCLKGCSNKNVSSTISENGKAICGGKEDGNYPHPTRCSHYIACVNQEHAYEMPCAFGSNGKRLHFVRDSGLRNGNSVCNLPETVGCKCPCYS